MDLKEEHILGDEVNTHWYYRSKLAALTALTRGLDVTSILDVGAGSGYFARALLRDTAATGATCVDPGYPANHDDDVNGKPIAFRREVANSTANLVLMMDVIEHVADDAALVRHYAAKVAPGTRFIVTVPAFMWLWSGHDVFLEHYRRYTLAQLESVLESAGLTVERGNYFYGAVLPLVAGVRFAKKLGPEKVGSDMGRQGPLLNRILYAVSAAEAKLMGANRLAGTTVFAQAVKR